MIANISCQDIQAWFTTTPTFWEEFHLDSELVEHVSACPSCRARLMLLLNQLLDITHDPEQTDIEDCPEELLTYIDLEQERGVATAIRAFPHVWWHLWQCEECSERYEDIVGLIQEHGNLFGGLVPDPKQSKPEACCSKEFVDLSKQAE